MTTMHDQEIIFDKNSGISEEEQRDILAQINSIAEKNRLSLSAAAPDDSPGQGKESAKPLFQAKKTGSLFPTIVNASAAVVLVVGLIALAVFQGKTDAQVREGAKVYTSTERALIEEIRKETSVLIEEKENEISLITSKLDDIDAELRELYSSNQELSEEQQETESRLIAIQENYRMALENLQDERSLILEEARVREAELQARLESRTRELALAADRSAEEISFAQSELERLNREQSTSSTVVAEMGAFLANLSAQISENRLDDAAATVQSIRNFLYTPAFQSLRAIQARKALYTQVISSFETMIENARRNQAGGAMPDNAGAEKTIAEIQERYTRLEQNLADRDRTIAALSSQGSGTAQILAEKDNEIASLRTDLTEQTSALKTENTELNQTIKTQEDSLSQIKLILQDKDIDNMSFNEIRDNVSKIQEALQTLE